MSALEKTQTKPKDDLAAGKGTWKRCLSRRLNRFYYYNSVTKESKWSINDVIEPLKMVESKESISSGSGHLLDRPNRQALQNAQLFPEPTLPPTDGIQLLDSSIGPMENDKKVELEGVKLFKNLLNEPFMNQMLESHFQKFLSMQRMEAGTSGIKNSLVTSTENINTTQSTDMEYHLKAIDLENPMLKPRSLSHATDLPLNERFKHTTLDTSTKKNVSTSVGCVSSSNSFCLERSKFKSNGIHDAGTADSCTDHNLESSRINLNEAINKSDDSAESCPGEETNIEQEIARNNVPTHKVSKKVNLNRSLPPNDLRLTLRKKREQKMSQMPNENEVQDQSENRGTLFKFDETKLEEHLKEFKEKTIRDMSVSENDDSIDYGDANSTFAPDTKVMNDSANSNTLEDEANLESEVSADYINLGRLADLYHYVNGEGDWYLIVDTNILLGNLSFVQTLCGVSEEADIAPIVLVPWKVLSELDNIRDPNKKMCIQLRKAKTFLNNHLHTRQRRSKVFGQTVLENSSKMFKCRSSDDEILNCCMQKVHEGYHVGLLSNDVNLCNKAIVNNIMAYSVRNLKMLLQQGEMEEYTEATSNKATNLRFDQKELSSIEITIGNNQNQRQIKQADIEEKKTSGQNSENNVTVSNAGESFSALIRNLGNDELTSTTPKHVMAISSSLGSLNLGQLGGLSHSSSKSKDAHNLLTETKISSTTENSQKTRKREAIVYDANDLKQKHHVLKKSKLECNTNVKKSIMNDAPDNIFRRFNLENPITNTPNKVNSDVANRTILKPFSSNDNIHIFRQVNVASGQIKTLKSPGKLSNVKNNNAGKNIIKSAENNLALNVIQKEPTPKKKWFRQSSDVASSKQNNTIRKKKVLLKRKKLQDFDSHGSMSQSNLIVEPNVEKKTQPLSENVISSNVEPLTSNISAEMYSRETSFLNVFCENNWNTFETNMTVPQDKNHYRNMNKIRKTYNNQNASVSMANCGKNPYTNEISSTQNDVSFKKEVPKRNAVIKTNNDSETVELLQKVSKQLAIMKSVENTNLKADTSTALPKRITLIRDAVNERRNENLSEGNRPNGFKKNLWSELSINMEKGQILIREEWECWSCTIRQMLENVLSTFLEKVLSSGGDVCKWILPSPWSLHDALGCLVKVMPPGSEFGTRELRQKIVDLATTLSQIINQYRCAGDLKLPQPNCDVFLEFFNSSRLLILSFAELNIENWISEELTQAKSCFENILKNLKYYIREHFDISECVDKEIALESSPAEPEPEERLPSPVKDITSTKEDSYKKVFEYLNKYYPSFSHKRTAGNKEPKISENEVNLCPNKKSVFDSIIDEIDSSENVNKNVKFDDLKKSCVNDETKNSSNSPKKCVKNTKFNNLKKSNVAKTKLNDKNVTKLSQSLETKNSLKFDFTNIKISRTITNDRINLGVNEKNNNVIEKTNSEVVVPMKKQVDNSKIQTIVRKLDFSIPKSKQFLKNSDFKINKKRSNSDDSGIVNENCDEINEKKCEENINVVLALAAIEKTLTGCHSLFNRHMEKWVNRSTTNNFTSELGAETIVPQDLTIVIKGIKSFLTADSENDSGLDQAVEAINRIHEKDLNGRKIAKEAMRKALQRCDFVLTGLEKFEDISQVLSNLAELSLASK